MTIRLIDASKEDDADLRVNGSRLADKAPPPYREERPPAKWSTAKIFKSNRRSLEGGLGIKTGGVCGVRGSCRNWLAIKSSQPISYVSRTRFIFFRSLVLSAKVTHNAIYSLSTVYITANINTGAR